MKYIIITLLVIPFFANCQELTMSFIKAKNNLRVAEIFEADKDHIQFLHVNNTRELQLCDYKVDSEEHNCVPVKNYKESLSGTKLVPIKLLKTPQNNYVIFFFEVKKGAKNLYQAYYDKENNELKEITSICSFESYKSKSYSAQSGFRVFQSENKKFTALVDYNVKVVSAFKKPELIISYALFNENLQLVKHHVTKSNQYISCYKPYNYSDFRELEWFLGDAVLSNEGTFYNIQMLTSGGGFAILTSTMESDEFSISKLKNKEFGKHLPYINKNAKKGIELWAFNYNSGNIHFELYSSMDGKAFEKDMIFIPEKTAKTLGISPNDKHLFINSIDQTPNGDTYLFVSPLQQEPVKYSNINYNIQGLFIFKLDGKKLLPIHQKRFDVKMHRGKTVSLTDNPYVWSAIIDNKIVYSFVGDRSYGLFLQSIEYNNNMISLDYETGKVENVEISIPKKYREVSSLYPKSFSDTENSFEILFYKPKSLFFLYKDNTEVSYQF